MPSAPLRTVRTLLVRDRYAAQVSVRLLARRASGAELHRQVEELLAGLLARLEELG